MIGIHAGSAVKTRLFVLLQQISAFLHRAQTTVTTLGRSFTEERQRLQEALRAKQNNLKRLLANSPDAVVVTNRDRRLVAANSIALDLFGISESNMKEFTIDAFLSFDQVRVFEQDGRLFKRWAQRYGKCTVRRLDGSLRVTEYIYVPNVVPRRHLFRFRSEGFTVVDLSIAEGKLTLHVRGADKLWAFKNRLVIPLVHITGIRADAEIARGWFHGLRMPGTSVPGIITAGTFYQDGKRVFWDVHHPERTVVIDLIDEGYSELIVEVDDPQAAVRLIQSAL